MQLKPCLTFTQSLPSRDFMTSFMFGEIFSRACLCGKGKARQGKALRECV